MPSATHSLTSEPDRGLAPEPKRGFAPDPMPHGALSLAQDIVAAAATRRALVPRQYGVDQWAAAVNGLLDLQQFSAARYALQQLSPVYPKVEFVSNLSVVVENLPSQTGVTDFLDDTSKEFQVAPRKGSDTAVILFCGGGTHRLGMPLNAFHRWAGAIPASLIYLRDFRHRFFLDGIPSLGDGLQGTLEALRSVLADLNVRRTFCYGFSVGGFAALYYALPLKAQRVLALAPAVTLEPRFNNHLRWAQAARRISTDFPRLTLDMVSQYAASPTTPRTKLVYGEHNWDDRLHAEYMAPVRYVELHPLAGFEGHNPTIELIRRRELSTLFNEFFATGS
jgi:hypothetical protein